MSPTSRRGVDAARRNSGAATAEGMPADPVAAALVEAAWWGGASFRADAAVQKDDEVFVGPGSAKRRLASSKPSLSVLCRTREQAEAALEVDWLDEIVSIFWKCTGCRLRWTRFARADDPPSWRRRGFETGRGTAVAFYLKLGADALLVRSAGLMQTLTRSARRTNVGGARARPAASRGFSLNAANAVGAARFRERGGLERLTPTHDLALGNRRVGEALGPRARRRWRW